MLKEGYHMIKNILYWLIGEKKEREYVVIKSTFFFWGSDRFESTSELLT